MRCTGPLRCCRWSAHWRCAASGRPRSCASGKAAPAHMTPWSLAACQYACSGLAAHHIASCARGGQAHVRLALEASALASAHVRPRGPERTSSQVRVFSPQSGLVHMRAGLLVPIAARKLCSFLTMKSTEGTTGECTSYTPACAQPGSHTTAWPSPDMGRAEHRCLCNTVPSASMLGQQQDGAASCEGPSWAPPCHDSAGTGRLTRADVALVAVLGQGLDHLVAAARVLDGEHIRIQPVDGLQRMAGLSWQPSAAEGRSLAWQAVCRGSGLQPRKACCSSTPHTQQQACADLQGMQGLQGTAVEDVLLVRLQHQTCFCLQQLVGLSP